MHYFAFITFGVWLEFTNISRGLFSLCVVAESPIVTTLSPGNQSEFTLPTSTAVMTSEFSENHILNEEYAPKCLQQRRIICLHFFRQRETSKDTRQWFVCFWFLVCVVMHFTTNLWCFIFFTQSLWGTQLPTVKILGYRLPLPVQSNSNKISQWERRLCSWPCVSWSSSQNWKILYFAQKCGLLE